MLDFSLRYLQVYLIVDTLPVDTTRHTKKNTDVLVIEKRLVDLIDIGYC